MGKAGHWALWYLLSAAVEFSPPFLVPDSVLKSAQEWACHVHAAKPNYWRIDSTGPPSSASMPILPVADDGPPEEKQAMGYGFCKAN